MPLSKAQKQVKEYIRKHPNASIKEATDAMGRNDYAEVKSMIDDGVLEVHGEVGHHTLTLPGEGEEEE